MYKRIFHFFRKIFNKKSEKWVGSKDFVEYGFEKTGNSAYKKLIPSCCGKKYIILKYITYDNWHVFKDGKDLGRFYTDWALRDRVKKHFGIKLKK